MSTISISSRVFELFLDNNNELYPDTELFEILKNSFPQNSDNQILIGITAGKQKIKFHLDSLKDRKPD